MSELHWEGYVDLGTKGVSRVEIYDAGTLADVYVNNELCDDVFNKVEFAEQYGKRFYKTLEDYKNDDWLDIGEVWPEGAE